MSAKGKPHEIRDGVVVAMREEIVGLGGVRVSSKQELSLRILGQRG